MAIKPSGPIGLGTDLPAEFGGTAPFSLSQYYRGGGRVPDSPQNAAVPTSGAISLGNFYNAVNVLPVEVSGNVVNYNLYNAFVAIYGPPTGSVPVRLDITPGSVLGGSGAAALTIGQFPSGSTIEIYNNGQILGYGGAANSGAGGDAVYAAYGGQTMTFYNQPGALCYGGGGGGGKGGTGGAGGGGKIINTVFVGVACGTSAFKCECGGCPGGTYPQGQGTCSCLYGEYKCSNCYRDDITYTSGGGGGEGGNGGRGTGYGQTKTAGDPGAGGAAGGTNAGAGGSGGSGGNGADWGVTGGTGNTGSTGANGNNGSGQAGAGGAFGGNGGRYYVRGGADFTFVNNGGATAGGIG